MMIVVIIAVMMARDRRVILLGRSSLRLGN